MREFKDLKIAVAGTGYVGLSIATLLSQHHKVTAVDIIPEKVELINNKKSPIQDEYIEKYLAEKELDLTATLDAKEAYSDADFVVIAAPTNYDSKKNFFDTSAVEAVIKLVIEYNPEAIMVIKSTIPVGYTASVREKFHCDNIIFSPEFLRESKALYDNLYPSRIIVGTDVDNAHDVFFVGRGIDYAVCLEGSLKLKEISYIHSEAYAAGELKHGTISLIEQGTLVIGVLTQSELYEKTVSNMVECKSRGAYLMGLTTYGKYEIEDQVNFTVYVPKVDEHFVGSLAVIPLQLLGYYVSVAKGLDVDKPRNLAKSVTVE